MAVPVPPGTEDRTARITLRRPDHWQRETPSGADLRVGGDGITVTVRSRPSDLGIGDESTALLGRLPGSVEGVLVVGCDVWTSADAPARLVEYTLPSVDDEGDDTFVSHLLLTTGRHRIDVVVERALATLRRSTPSTSDAPSTDAPRTDAPRTDPPHTEAPETGAPDTDDLVFSVLESVRAVGPVAGGRSAQLETFPEPHEHVHRIGPHLGTDAFATLRGIAGKRWNPAVARTPGGRALVEAGVLGRFGTIPPETSAALEPWAAATEPWTLRRTVDGGAVTSLQAWSGATDVTVVDGTDETGYAVGTVPPERLVAIAAGRLGIRPAWTWPFKTGPLPAELVERRLAGGSSRPDLPAESAAADARLARFWDAPWAVSTIRRPGKPTPIVIVSAGSLGFARVGRTEAGATAFSAAAPANVYRLLVRSVLR